MALLCLSPASSEVTPNPSIDRTSSGLRPPSASHVKRYVFMKQHLIILAGLAALAFSTLGYPQPFGQMNEERIRNAAGDTPVRFVYCYIRNDRCEVWARFRNMYECERHWQIFNSYCDRVSIPGKINCRREDSPLKDVEFSSYCVP